MSEQLGEAVLVLRTDDRGLDSGIAAAKGKSEQLGRTLDATSGSSSRLGAALTATGRDAVSGSQGLQANAQAAVALDAAQKRVTGSAGMARHGFMDLGRQISDVSTMYALGARPMQIFASQSGQIFQSIQMAAGGAKGFASFMGGPWGIAIQIAVLALLPLIGKLLESGDAAAAAAKQMQAKAREDEAARAALELYGRTVEGHIEKERKLREELDKQIKSQRLLNQERAVGAAKNAEDLKTDVSNLERDLAKAREAQKSADALLRNPPRGTMDSATMSGFAAAASRAADEVKRLEGELKKVREEARAAEQTARAAQIPGIQEAVQGRLDKAKGAVIEYTDALDKLNAQYEKGQISPAKYGAEFARLTKQLEAAKAAAKDAAKALRETGEMSRFILPVSGPVKGQFGEQRAGHKHAGLDLAVPVGTPVKAPAAGTVIEAGTLPGYGNVVFIDHGGGTISRLAHLSRLDTAVGKTVTQGQVVGLSGGAKGAPGAGNSEGPHVHYEVLRGRKAVDPRSGPFPTDTLGAAEKADEVTERAAAEAERKREQEVRRKDQFDQASAQLDDRLLDLKARGLFDEAARAQIDRDRVNLAEARYSADLKAQQATGELTAAEAEILAAKHKLLSALQLEAIDAEERARLLKAGTEVELQLSEFRLELLRAQEGLARTSAQRRELALAMLAEEEKQARIVAETTIALFKQGQATEEAARKAEARLKQLDELHPVRVEEIKRQNQGPLDDWLEKTDPAKTQERVEGYVVDELEALHRGITDAVADKLGVEDPLLRSLIALFIEQVLIRPIAEALQSMQGGGGAGGGLGGLLGSLLGGLLGGAGGAGASAASAVGSGSVMPQYAGGFAKGGLIPNGSYGVVHDGEKVFPTSGGAMVVPNRAPSRGNDGAGMQVAFNNDFRGADAAAVAGIERRLNRMQQELPGQIVSTMQDARTRFVWRQ